MTRSNGMVTFVAVLMLSEAQYGELVAQAQEEKTTVGKIASEKLARHMTIFSPDVPGLKPQYLVRRDRYSDENDMEGAGC